MDLSNELISQFAKLTNNNDKNKSSETTVYATTVEYDGQMCVKIDGSDQLTPVETTTDIQNNQRVTVMIKDHKATVTGNISDPSVGTGKMNAAIEVKESSILLGVSENYVSNNTLNNYSTTSEMNAAIELKASGILLGVSETYVTNDTLNNYSTTSTMNSAIEQKANSILSTVSSTYVTNDTLNNYSTTTEMNSAIEQKANSILSTVSSTYVSDSDASKTYATKSELNQTSESWTATFESGYNKGIVEMNQWGIKVTHSDFSGWSHITSSGFYIHNGTEDVVQLTTRGLEIKGAIKGGSTIDIGTSDDGTRSAFQVASDGVVGIGNTKTLNGVTYPAFRVGNTGNLKIGGASAYIHTDGKRKGIAEITSEGTIWSCSETLPYTYARLTEGKLEISNTGHDPEYNGGSYVKDSYIKLENGQIAIYSASDANYSKYVRSIYMNQEGIGSALGHVDFVNRINVTGNVTTTGQLILSSNNNGIKGTDTDGEQITLAHVGADNVCRFGYGSWASQGSYAYNEGTEFMGGETATLKAKNKVLLSCNNIGTERNITFHNDSTGSYVFRPNGSQKDILCGTSNYPWKKVYAQSGCETTSDRTEKENIQYLSYDNINTLADINDTITTNECLDFITNDYLLATYNYVSDVNKETKLSAIAQDVIVNIDGSDNKIGQLIVDAKGSAKEDALLCMNQTQLLNVAIGAIQQLNTKVNELENRLKNS